MKAEWILVWVFAFCVGLLFWPAVPAPTTPPARSVQAAIAEAHDHIHVVFEDEATIACGLRENWYQCVARLRTLGGTVRLHCSGSGDGCYAINPECSQ